MKLKEIKPGMVIHCKTKEQTKVLANELDNLGYTWVTREKLTERCSIWDKYTDICLTLRIDKTITWSEYKDSKDDDKVEITEFSSLIIEEKTYEDGLNEAWAAAKKIVLRKEHGGLLCKDLERIFEREPEWEVEYSVFKNLTPQEVIAKLEAYEAEKQIKLGDVVEYFTAVSNPHFGIYLSETRDEHWVLTPYCEAPQSLEKKTGWQFKKTGKHIDISSILAEIGKE